MAKNNPLDDIVKCDIEISSPVASSQSDDAILLVVPAPAEAGTESTANVFSVKRISDLAQYGYTEGEVAYQACVVAFSQNPAPEKIYIIARTETETTTETMKDCLDRADAQCDFYGIHITSYRDSTDTKAAADWAEAKDKLFGFEYTDYDSMPLTQTDYARTFAFYAGDAEGYDTDSQPAANGYLALAAMAKCFGYDAGTETWNLKELSNIVQSSLTETKKSALSDKNINMYLRYADSNVTVGGMTLAGEWIDVIRFRDWLKKNIKSSVFAVLKANKKVPFTDSGIGLVAGALTSVLLQGQRIGGIAPTEYDDDGNETLGFTVTVPTSASFTEAERKSRKLTNLTWQARLAGAIHIVTIEGTLSY